MGNFESTTKDAGKLITPRVSRREIRSSHVDRNEIKDVWNDISTRLWNLSGDAKNNNRSLRRSESVPSPQSNSKSRNMHPKMKSELKKSPCKDGHNGEMCQQQADPSPHHHQAKFYSPRSKSVENVYRGSDQYEIIESLDTETEVPDCMKYTEKVCCESNRHEIILDPLDIHNEATLPSGCIKTECPIERVAQLEKCKSVSGKCSPESVLIKCDVQDYVISESGFEKVSK